MLTRVFAISVFVIAASVPAFAENFKFNKEKSKITFVGKKKDGKHEGGFKEFKSDAKVDLEAPEKSSLEIVIDTTSLWSDDAKLTDHLKNPDFFDVRKHPKITFESTKIEHSDSEATITGKLTLLDKTVEVKVPVKSELTDKSIIVNAEFKIDRTKWGMNFGKGNINDEVEIKATLQFDR